MTELSNLQLDGEDGLPATQMTVEQALGREKLRSWLNGTVKAAWGAAAILAAGFRLMCRRAQRHHRPAIALTILLVLVASAWMAAVLLPEREIVGPEALRIVAKADESSRDEPAPPVAASLAATPPGPTRPDAWVPIRKPIALYHVEAPELEQAELIHRAASHDRRSRQDRFLWLNGQVRPASLQRPAILLVVERYEAGLPAMRPFFPDLALRAAELDISIERLQGVDEVPTKFGAMQVADAILESDRGRLACLAFRRIDTAGLVISGWYCGLPARPADRVSFACFIDRLDMVGGGQDHALRRLFSEAERQRKSCPLQRQPGRKVTWLDHEAPVPALKLSARAR